MWILTLKIELQIVMLELNKQDLNVVYYGITIVRIHAITTIWEYVLMAKLLNSDRGLFCHKQRKVLVCCITIASEESFGHRI